MSHLVGDPMHPGRAGAVLYREDPDTGQWWSRNYVEWVENGRREGRNAHPSILCKAVTLTEQEAMRIAVIKLVDSGKSVGAQAFRWEEPLAYVLYPEQYIPNGDLSQCETSEET